LDDPITPKLRFNIVTDEPSQIEVTVIGEAAVIRFTRTDGLMSHGELNREFREELFTFVDSGRHSVIALDFGNPDIHWLSGASYAVLVSLHHRLFKANRVLKLCNVPDMVMTKFQDSQLVKYFNIYPDVETALKPMN
jgi:anti-anti-sigma regulatory factor